MPKLHLGCGKKILKDWINCDINPKENVPSELAPYYKQMDCKQPFQFEDDSIDCIYTEDFIEHFLQPMGLLILVECRRILKKGGVIRISTPNLTYWMKPDKMKERGGSNDSYQTFAPLVATHWLKWKHIVLYTTKFLEETLLFAGFKNITLCEFSKSKHKELKNIDSRQEQEKSNIYLEATK